MEFFHVNRFLFAPGAVILPGGWGRPILNGRMYSGLNNNGVNYFILFREYVFEQIRLELFSKKPSRLQGTFICPNFVSAHNFWETERAESEIIYRVEILEDKPFHVSPWTLANQPNSPESIYYAMPKAAKNYWEFPQKDRYDLPSDNMLEAITESPIKILEVVQGSSV